MKSVKTNPEILREWWSLAPLAVEAGMEYFSFKNRGLQSELTESEFLDLFVRKYNHPISKILEEFETTLYNTLNSSDDSFFSRSNFESRIR